MAKFSKILEELKKLELSLISIVPMEESLKIIEKIVNLELTLISSRRMAESSQILFQLKRLELSLINIGPKEKFLKIIVELENLELSLKTMEQSDEGGGGGIQRRKVPAGLVSFLKPPLVRPIPGSILKRIERIPKGSPSGEAGAPVFITPCIDPNTASSLLCGRDAEREEVISLLLTHSKDEESGNLSVLPIVGMGGVGKTALAHAIYHDPRIKAGFDLRLWVRVGQVFDACKIEQALVEEISQERGSGFVALNLPKQLLSRRFLLVLDDVWNEDEIEWNVLLYLLRNCRPGSKILVTTRSLIVANIMGTAAPYRLEALSDDDCWEVFKLSAFALQRDAVVIPYLVQKTRKEIVAKCRGLPLAAVLFGNHVRANGGEFKRSTSIKDELLTCSQDILSSLMPGYDRMPAHLKKCFACCSIFPKDYRIDRLKLIYLWIAEGCIDTSFDSRPLEEIGQDYFDYMLQNFFFQDERKDDYGNIVSCKMHDFIRDLACFVAREESYAVTLGEETRLPRGCLHLSVTCDDHNVSSGFLKDAACAGQLRTLFIFGQTPHLARELDEFIMHAIHLRALQYGSFPIREFPCTIGKLRFLRFLDLSDTMIESVDESIADLYDLHFLDLSNTKVEVLPKSITALYNLQTLRAGHCVKLQELPLAIGKLRNLRLLDLSHSVLQSLPDSIASLCSLQTLNLSSCSKLQKLPLTIGELHNLRVLSLSYSRVQSLPESIADLTNLQILNLKDCSEIRELTEGVQNMVNLNHLEIGGCQLACMPCCLGRLTNLQTLPLFVVGNKPGHTIEELQHLNHLRGVLKITCLNNVKHPEEAMTANLAAKEGIHSLELRWRTGWTRKWGEVMIDTAAIPQPSKENFDLHVFQNLRPHENIRHLTVEDYGGSTFPTWLSKLNELSSLRKLESFSLYNLEKCVHLPPLGHLPSLQHLKIESMYALKCIDTFGGKFLSLKYLKLWNLPSLKECFDMPEQQMFPSLETLIIVGCPELRKTHLPPSLLEFEMESVNEDILVGGCLEGLSRLRKLRIAHFEAPESWWEGMRFLTSLESLEIMNCFWTTLPNCIMQRHFPSLQTLKLALNNDLMSLGEGEGEEPPLFFSELCHLSIQGCDELTELPEWLCGLKFLQSMELLYCDNLEMIPNRLRTNLAQLTISGCPKLEVSERSTSEE